MFFPRLRRHAKWMFVFLALVFGVGFVIFGVGAGGVGVGDIFRGSSGESGSIADARERVAENPKDAAGWRELSTALQTEGRTVEAIDAMERYVDLRPKDPDGQRELGTLWLSRGQELAREVQVLQVQAVYSGASTQFVPRLDVGKTSIGEDRIASALEDAAGTRIADVSARANDAFANAVSVYEDLVKLQPDDPNIQLELAQTAEQTGNATVAIRAYERFLKLAPDDPNAEIVKEQLKQLRPAAGG